MGSRGDFLHYPGGAGKPVGASPPPHPEHESGFQRSSLSLGLGALVLRVTRLERHGFAFGALEFHGHGERLAVLIELVGHRARSALRLHLGDELLAIPAGRNDAARVGRVGRPIQLALAARSVVDLERVALAEDHELLGLGLRTRMIATASTATFARRTALTASFATAPAAVVVATAATPAAHAAAHATATTAPAAMVTACAASRRKKLGRIVTVLLVEHPDAGEVGNLRRV